MKQIHQRQFLHNMYFYNRMFNFEVYTLLQSMINCNSSILVHGRKGSGGDELLKTLFDAKSNSVSTLYLGPDSIKGLYPRRKIMEINSSNIEAMNVSPLDFGDSTAAVVNGLTASNIELFLSMCSTGHGLASLEGETINFALDEAAELLGNNLRSKESIGAIDYVLTVEAHKLVSISEVISLEGKHILQPFAEFVGGNEYSFYSCVSASKIEKMRLENFEEAERFVQSIKTYSSNS
ncbi:hypothetical protein [Paenibacillus terrae]|uniref:Uncharacterized protein n=1 Tax=Paenibacillus terrae TaxID=159743 RepID=A0A0D7WW53_9BACL|nr:hypothetical protein [Paenibacillus terrae]KJD42953.1 hypothetical protein QD47_25380 [Paenibacillus terrae]